MEEIIKVIILLRDHNSYLAFFISCDLRAENPKGQRFKSSPGHQIALPCKTA